MDIQQPPQEYVDARPTPRVELHLPRWRVETVCRLIGALPPGRVHGCSMVTIGGCFVIVPRDDDGSILRHELAHCNGWRH